MAQPPNASVNNENTPFYEPNMSVQYDDGDSTVPLLDDNKGDDNIAIEPVKQTKNALGTFMGVYVPCILSIFGVVLFERLSWMVGQAGIVQTFVMFFMAFTVVTLTTLSLSAIATNGEIKGGGAYYMISRCLGPEFGGSIGIVFYLANVVGGATYLLGFAAALAAASEKIPQGHWEVIAYALAALVLLTGISFLGADVFAKTFIVIFLCLLVAIGTVSVSLATNRHMFSKPALSPDPTDYTGNSTYVGWDFTTFKSNILSSYGPSYSFNVVFSIFFPSVTGIMAGANMSGDLRDPGRSIPSGTLLAVFTALIVYSILVIALGFTTTRDTLKHDYFAFATLAYNKWPVIQGVWMATLSSALGSILGGARILQALARDELLPLGFFAKGSKKGDEPRRAVLVTALLILAVCLIGNLNAVLPFVTMFYFLTYGMTNFACFMLSISGAPNFRPTFKYFTWWSSLIAAVACIAFMFYLNPIYAGVSIILFILLFGFLYFKASEKQWGDITQAVMFHQVRKYLLRLDSKQHVKNWRPSLLLLIQDIPGSLSLIDFGNNLKKGGLYIIGTVYAGDPRVDKREWKEHQQKLEAFTRESHLKAFAEVVCSEKYDLGAANLIMTAGIGGMKPNTVLIAFNSFQGKTTDFGSVTPELAKKFRRKKSSRNAGGNNTEEHILPMDDMSAASTPKGFKRCREQIQRIYASTTLNSPIRMDVTVYLDILRNVIEMERNLLLARNFDKHSKGMILGFAVENSPNLVRKMVTSFKKRVLMSIDIWVPMYQGYIDEEKPTALLALQLGYILSTSSDVWKKNTHLRIIGLVEKEKDVKDTKDALKTFLYRTRVGARYDVFALSETALYDEIQSKDESDSKGVSLEEKILDDSLDGISELDKQCLVNQVIKQHSRDTAVLFVPMPRNPVDVTDTDADHFIQELDALSKDLPPTLMVHGVDAVIAAEM